VLSRKMHSETEASRGEKESRFPKDFPQLGDGVLAGSLGTGKSLD
jgi:hypothetical protein